MQAQCWICPQCHDDSHHEPGDKVCERNRTISELRDQIDVLQSACENTVSILCGHNCPANNSMAIQAKAVMRRLHAADKAEK